MSITINHQTNDISATNGSLSVGGGALSHRNMVANGAMTVAQRGISVTGVTSSGYRTCDRFVVSMLTLGTWTISQSTDAPEGFANSLKLDCTTADASPAAGDYLFIDQRIEGQNLQMLKKGTSNALPLTLSFWVKSSKTGNFQVNLNDIDNTRIISSVVTINATSTWEQKIITFDGDTTGTLGNDNDTSLRLEMWFDAGSNWTSGATATAWESLVSADRAAGTTLALGNSTSNELYITGVQLEVGDTATPFEHRPYGEELARCQRYYYRFGSVGDYEGITTTIRYSSTYSYGPFVYPQEMRATPTFSASGTFNLLYAGTSTDTTDCTSTQISKYSCSLKLANNGTSSSGYPHFVRFKDSATTYIDFDAEL